MENCKHCNEILSSNFCANCGQKKYKRIDKKYIWDELQYTLIHTNKGLLYSIKNVLKNPGKTAREYVDGKRVSHYKPIALVFILSGIATFISFKLLHFDKVMMANPPSQNANAQVMHDVIVFLASYSALIMVAMVPLFAITTKIAYKKWGQNYYEHIVMNAYILSYYTLLSIILVYPIMFAFRHNPSNFMAVSQFSLLLVPFILVWFFKGFYSEKPLSSIILKTLAVLGLTLLGYLILIFAAGIGIFIFK